MGEAWRLVGREYVDPSRQIPTLRTFFKVNQLQRGEIDTMEASPPLKQKKAAAPL